MTMVLVLLIPFLICVPSTYFVKELSVRENLYVRLAANETYSAPKLRLGEIGIAL